MMLHILTVLCLLVGLALIFIGFMENKGFPAVLGVLFLMFAASIPTHDITKHIISSDLCPVILENISVGDSLNVAREHPICSHFVLKKGE